MQIISVLADLITLEINCGVTNYFRFISLNFHRVENF